MHSKHILLSLFIIPLALTAFAQTTPSTAPAITRPAIAIDLSTPAAALASYFRAEQAIDFDAILKTIDISEARKKPYVGLALNFRLWRHTLERQAIQRFGNAEGIQVEGHARSLDDELARDLAILKDATLEQTRDAGGNPVATKLFMPLEKDAPEGVQTDRFEFVTVFYLSKTGGDWKLDFLKTYDCLGEDKEALLKFEAGIFPIMANHYKELADQVKKGAFPTADALKAALDARWKKTYGEDAATEPATAP